MMRRKLQNTGSRVRANFHENKERALRLISHDIGIDLGTTNTLVYLRGKGIVINEPSVVAVNRKTNQIVDIGAGAKQMLGRTPSHIEAIRPLVDGVISNFEVAEEMLAYLIDAASKHGSRALLGPRVVIGVPTGITNVERRAVRDAATNAGARRVYIVEEPMAAAIGMQLPVNDPIGNMIVDIGGGTSDMAIISLGGVVVSQGLSIAGESFNRDIISYVRDQFKILIGEKTAEDIKIAVGSAAELDEPLEISVKGRDLVTGLPRAVALTDTDVREAITPSLEHVTESIRRVLESAPPEVVSDIVDHGVFLVGGGALLRKIDTYLNKTLDVTLHTSDDPMTAVVRGTSIILERLREHDDILITDEDDVPIAIS